MKRREAIQLLAAAAAGSLISGNSVAQSQKLRVLIFGGTGFLGPHFVQALQAGAIRSRCSIVVAATPACSRIWKR